MFSSFWSFIDPPNLRPPSIDGAHMGASSGRRLDAAGEEKNTTRTREACWVVNPEKLSGD